MKVGDEFNPWRMFHGAWLPNWLLERNDVNPLAKLVYARFCQHGGEDGEVFPKIETLAKEVGCSERGVRKAIQELEDLKLIQTQDRRPNRQSSIYKFLMHEWILEALQMKPLASATERQAQSAGRKEQSAGRRPEQSAGLSLRDSQEKIPGKESLSARPIASLMAEAPQAERPDHPEPPSNTEGLNSSPDPRLLPHVGGGGPTNVDSFVQAAQDRVLRQNRARLTIGDASAKTTEAQARKLAKQHLKEKWRAAAEDELPMDKPEKTPLAKLQHLWRAEMFQAFPDIPPPTKWGGKEFGQVQMLLDRYDLSVVQTTFEYTIRNWIKLRNRFFKGTGGPVPTTGVILRMHDSIVPEASVWEKHREVIAEYKGFGGDYERRPRELTERYLEAQKELQALGLD